MRLRISSIHAAAAERPEGYVDDVMSKGQVDGEWLEISAEDLAALRDKYRPPPEPTPVLLPDPDLADQMTVQPPPLPTEVPPHVRNLPSLPRMAMNVTRAMAEEAAALARGEPRVTAEEAAARIAICHDCEFFIAQATRCAHCGCFLNMKLKMRSQSCPIGKW